MIKDSKIQLFLRNLLLDSLEANSIDVPVLFEGTTKDNLGDTFIVEQLIPKTEEAWSDRVEKGNGLYKLTVFSDIGKGLYLTNIVDVIREAFSLGEYVVDKTENIILVINNPIPSSIIYEKSSDKMQKSVTVSYTKFKSI